MAVWDEKILGQNTFGSCLSGDPTVVRVLRPPFTFRLRLFAPRLACTDDSMQSTALCMRCSAVILRNADETQRSSAVWEWNSVSLLRSVAEFQERFAVLHLRIAEFHP